MSTLVLENIWAWAVQVAAVAAAGLVLPVLARLTSPPPVSPICAPCCWPASSCRWSSRGFRSSRQARRLEP